VPFAALLLCAKCGGDLLLSRALRGDFHAVRYLPLIPLKDLSIFVIWALGLFKRRIHWRGHSMLIGPETRLSRDPQEHGAVVEPGRA
jgi:hypothetical protein